ncbi:hypothetical protein [Lysobacter gummosus]|uniref:hypothetical protein n=1 Tax=Lysobacter gummosus TaxID=262324 RepID=UPI00362CA62E
MRVLLWFDRTASGLKPLPQKTARSSLGVEVFVGGASAPALFGQQRTPILRSTASVHHPPPDSRR